MNHVNASGSDCRNMVSCLFCLGKRLKYRCAAEMKLFNVKQGGVNDMQDIDKGNFNRSTTTHTCFTKEMIQCDT